LAQLRQCVRLIRQYRLFYNLVKQLFDETVLRLFVADGKCGYILRVGQVYRLAIIADATAAASSPATLPGLSSGMFRLM
jgi:hypothetical protein